MAFKPRITPVEIEDGGETETFYIREAAGREVLGQSGTISLRLAREARLQKQFDAAIEAGNDAKAQEIIGKMRESADNARELFANYLVKGENDTTPIDKEAVDAILDMRLSAMQKISFRIQEVIGIRKPEGEQKNA